MKKVLLFLFSVILVSIFVFGIISAAGDDLSKKRMFVTGVDSIHYVAGKAIAGNGLRHTYDSPGNELTFSAELTDGQIKALEKLGLKVRPVEIWEIVDYKEGKNYINKKGGIAAKPVCGDGICQGNELTTCPQDCGTGGGRTCSPNQQREYNTYQVGGGNIGDGSGVKVTVLDTGTTTSHLDLNVKLCKDTTGTRIKNGCTDNNGHGTHTSGTIGANGGADGNGIFGIAPSADLWAIKVCGQFCFTDDIARGIDYATSQGTNIISMSIGGSKSDVVTNSVNNAVNNGVLFIASAGNSGPNQNTIGYPAALPNVVAVAANDADEIVVSFSSRGITDGNDTSIVEKEVEVSAGGFIVESTYNDGCYNLLSGTSMSTPTVAGFAAKNWQGSASATRTFLRNNVEDLTQGFHAAVGYDIAAGYGLTTTLANNDGDIIVTVTTDKNSYTQGELASITVTAKNQSNNPVANAFLTIGAHFPDGNWAYTTGLTDNNGQDFFTLDTLNVAKGTTVLVADVSKQGFTFGGGSKSIQIV